MAEHDYVIDNQSAPSFRNDLNNALMAIVSQNSKSTAPTTTYANMIWYDTTNNQLKKRNEANSAWVTLGTVDEGAGTFTPSGERSLATQAQAEAGTDNTTLMTPLRVSQAITALAGSYKNYQLFTASGTFTTPAGVSSAYAVVVGGGGGGGSAPVSGSGPNGGNGGVAGGVVTVSGSMAVTVGAGGNGSNTTVGSTGGTSTFSTLTATGGGPGTNGVGSGTGLLATNLVSAVLAVHPNALASGTLIVDSQQESRPNATSSTTALVYSLAGTYRPGANGTGESSQISSNATGGVGGAVFVFY